MGTTIAGIACDYVSDSEMTLRRGMIESAKKRLQEAEEDHVWLVSRIKPQNRKLADMHREALDAAQTIMARLDPDLPAGNFLDVHALLMKSLDQVAKALGSAIGWQGGKAKTGKAGGKGKIENNPEAKAKADVKNLVKEMWSLWQDKPANYKGKAAFARDMREKYPDELTSQKVIEDWCRDWEKDKS